MARICARFLLFLTAIFFAVTNPCFASPEKPVECSEMVQKNIMFGQALVTFTRDAIRIDKTGKHLWLLCKAPKWEVMEFSDERKSYYSMPLSQTKGDFNWGVHLVAGVQLQDLPTSPIPGEGEIAGIKIDKLKVQRAKQSIYAYKNRRKDYDPVQEAEIWVAKDTRLRPEIARFMELIYSLPKTGRLPIQLQYKDQSHNTRTFLSTASLKHITVPPDQFEPRRGYAKAKNFEEVQAPVNSTDLSDILQNIDAKPIK